LPSRSAQAWRAQCIVTPAARSKRVGTTDEIRHVVLLATTTIGFPAMMSAMSWVDDVLVPKS
jgi:alkylhydroperoxidase/carboxymuconolactone decarboxylase family protein YurZ